MEKNLTFDELPNAVTLLTDEVTELRRLLINSQEKINSEPLEKLLNVKETAQFLNLSIATIYSKVSRGELPVMKRGKRLYFSSIELLDYIKKGRKKTNDEIAEEAYTYLKKKGGENE